MTHDKSEDKRGIQGVFNWFVHSQVAGSVLLLACTIVHRLGHLEIGEASVAVAVSTAHREAAFESGKWLIDTIKEVVPIWKCENWASGSSEWVHPGVESPPIRSTDSSEPSEVFRS